MALEGAVLHIAGLHLYSLGRMVVCVHIVAYTKAGHSIAVMPFCRAIAHRTQDIQRIIISAGIEHITHIRIDLTALLIALLVPLI